MARREKTKSDRKDSQLIIRINGDMRNAFLDLCDEMDTSAAREIRRFIRGYLSAHSTEKDAEPVRETKSKKEPKHG
ncbi:hypothetical protein GGR95_001316 [Sulfitobacter undariae]|uniref:Ribbon-helix-helix protein, copG family n=1 Tax=Sulfitobacter undariae TaxID=1563671 RepID=A0A7W6E2S7_9RHOB|nr:hypothetical protein [Sulfitobacter undariae]MBB3993685.1 hypothetical protein [Sulfitobacter undariae]